MQMFCQGASSHTHAHARTHAHTHARTHNHVMEVYSIALRVVLFDQSDVCTIHMVKDMQWDVVEATMCLHKAVT